MSYLVQPSSLFQRLRIIHISAVLFDLGSWQFFIEAAANRFSLIYSFSIIRNNSKSYHQNWGVVGSDKTSFWPKVGSGSDAGNPGNLKKKLLEPSDALEALARWFCYCGWRKPSTRAEEASLTLACKSHVSPHTSHVSPKKGHVLPTMNHVSPTMSPVSPSLLCASVLLH